MTVPLPGHRYSLFLPLTQLALPHDLLHVVFNKLPRIRNHLVMCNAWYCSLVMSVVLSIMSKCVTTSRIRHSILLHTVYNTYVIKAALPSMKKQIVTVHFGGLSWKVIKGAISLHYIPCHQINLLQLIFMCRRVREMVNSDWHIQLLKKECSSFH